MSMHKYTMYIYIEFQITFDVYNAALAKACHYPCLMLSVCKQQTVCAYI